MSYLARGNKGGSEGQTPSTRDYRARQLERGSLRPRVPRPSLHVPVPLLVAASLVGLKELKIKLNKN